tara:strand:+ start:2094 stop:2603 length:510 start_codon:yes stop_codon:yes gene_type:complete
MKIFKVIAYTILGFTFVLIGARFSDGPIEIVAGGPFTSGKHSIEFPQWELIADRDTLEFQLVEPAVSRTIWFAVHDGRFFIPSGYMTTWWGKIWKQWPLQAELDGRAILRADGVLYSGKLVRIKEGDEIGPVLAELGRKYGGGDPFPRELFETGYLWLFELVSLKNHSS